MRIISGKSRGRRLDALSSYETRPTADRVKEALFSILQFQLEGRRFLDLFSGSGQIALEALSRGAALAVAVDSSHECTDLIRKNSTAVGLSENLEIRTGDYETFLATTAQVFDIVYIDPPYGSGDLKKALEAVVRITSPGGIIMCEHSSSESLPEKVGSFVKNKSYRYGKIALTSYRSEDEIQYKSV